MSRISTVVLMMSGRSQKLTLKPLLKRNGEWLLRRIFHTMTTLSDDLIIVGNEESAYARLPARVVPDVHPDSGPLGSIDAGLQAIRYERGLFVACDMPLLNLELLRYMILLAADFDAVIPRLAGNVEPLHAIYSKSCLPAIAKALERGERRIVSFFPEVRIRYVEQDEVDLFDPQHLSFFNINTPEDLDIARQALRNEARRKGT
ncbi:MAG: molybdenum cofactor guanylyltransferase [Chloroflexi bacterium]|nr:molybdenum cofactor guanylyltransferase [Chloroflexota bacterium]